MLSREPIPDDPDAPKSPPVLQLGALLSEWEEHAVALHDARLAGRPLGPVTGFAALDREFSGALPPGMHVMHGGPGAGKTALALQVAATCGFPALMVSCEMGRLELFRRVTARTTGTFLGRLKTGEFTPSESVALARRAAQACPQLAIMDATQEYASPAWIQEKAADLRGDSEHFLLVVDSVHSWADSWPGQATEYEALNLALAALRKLAAQLNCPVLAVAERNRASMSSGGLSAGAGSRKIEYGAESVWDLNRKKDADDAAGEAQVTLRLEKNRHGTAGKPIELRWNGALQKFREAF